MVLRRRKAINFNAALGRDQDEDEAAREEGVAKGRSQRMGANWLLTLGLATALVAGVRLWMADVLVMRSPAMAPTLTDGDRVMVDKLSYQWRSPERGEILVFNPPKMLQAMRPQATQPFLLRLVGLPGDRIKIQGGKLYVNGEFQAESYLQEAVTYDMAEVTIPAATYFVLGDNRNDSFDSSIWGIVPVDRVIGRGVGIVYPWGRLQTLSPPSPNIDDTDGN